MVNTEPRIKDYVFDGTNISVVEDIRNNVPYGRSVGTCYKHVDSLKRLMPMMVIPYPSGTKIIQ